MTLPVPEPPPAVLPGRRPEPSQSVERAAAILQALAADGPLRLTDLARRVGVPRQALQRLLTSLEQACLVRRDLASRRYDLGVALAAMGVQAEQRIDPARLAVPHLTALHQATGDAAALLVRQGPRAVCARVVAADETCALTLPMGQTLPLWQGVARVILAFVAEPERSHLLALSPLEDTAAALETIRTRGYVIARSDVPAATLAIAAPVFDGDGAPVAALVVHATPEAAQDTAAEQVRREAALLTTALTREAAVRATVGVRGVR